MVDDLAGPIRAGTNPFRGARVILRKNYLAGKNAANTLSLSRLDSATLSGSHVRFPIPARTNPFRGPRKIPRFLNGVFVGQFPPQVQIPLYHPQGEIISRAAACLRALTAHMTRSDFIEHQIWIRVTG